MNKTCKELSKQYQFEIAAANFYVMLENWFLVNSLHGFSKWAKQEAKEELHHAKVIAHYLGRLGELIEDTKPIEAEVEGKDIVRVIQEALQLEQEYLQTYNDMWFIAQEEKDVPAMELIGWFADVQRKSVNFLRCLVNKLDKCGSEYGAILQLDSEIA